MITRTGVILTAASSLGWPMSDLGRVKYLGAGTASGDAPLASSPPTLCVLSTWSPYSVAVLNKLASLYGVLGLLRHKI